MSCQGQRKGAPATRPSPVSSHVPVCTQTAEPQSHQPPAGPLTSPTLILLCSSSSRPLICGHSELGTYRREQAEHFWPPYSKAERSVPLTTLSTSAERCTKWKFFPPHSEGKEGNGWGLPWLLGSLWHHGPAASFTDHR